jgi:uncharacterized protein (TIGR02246 family)
MHIPRETTVTSSKTGAIACAFLAALAIIAFAAPARADAQADIKRLENRFVAAFKAKDPEAIMQVYAPGQALVVFDVVPPLEYVGAAAYRKDWQAFLGGFNGPITVELTDLDVGADRNLAYSHSIQRVSGIDKQGKKLDLTVRVTDIYRKIHGRWFIIHEHVSVPVDLATDKPDLNSKP